jgi:hypothetical protein
MPLPFEKRLNEWILDAKSGPEIQEVNLRIRQLEERLFSSYEPTKGPYPDFASRLGDWIDNLSDEDEQKALLKLVVHIFFLGPKEIDHMYRVAFNTCIAKWLIEQSKVMLDSPYAGEQLQTALRHTWICPITDSMRINAFYHLNNIPGRDYRPDWRSLQLFGDVNKIRNFIKVERIQRLVLLEDFVGTGEQIAPTVRFAATKFDKMPILIVPLVLCPSGLQLLARYRSVLANLQFSSVLDLGSKDFLCKLPSDGEPAIFANVRSIVESHYSLLFRGIKRVADLGKLYGPFGFNDTGGLVVLWTNCPDNTLPAIHHNNPPSWKPLFPRASRV